MSSPFRDIVRDYNGHRVINQEISLFTNMVNRQVLGLPWVWNGVQKLARICGESESESYMLRLSVAVMVTFSNIFMLIAISTNHWMLIEIRGDLFYVGIWKVCNNEACAYHTDIMQVKILMVILAICNILLNIFILFTVYSRYKDAKTTIGIISLVNAMAGFAAMLFATVYFTLHSNRILLYGLPLGWVGTVLIIASCVVSFIHSRLEPDGDSKLTDLIKNPSNPPPYPGTQTAPNSIVVS